MTTSSHGEAVAITFNLWRCVKLWSWDEGGGASCLRQVKGIDSRVVTALEFMGIRSIRELAGADPANLKQRISRDIETCTALVDRASAIADWATTASVLNGVVRLEVKTRCSTRFSTRTAADDAAQTCTLVVWSPASLLLFRERVHADTIIDVEIPDRLDESTRSIIYVRVFHDQFAGMDQRFEIDLDALNQQSSTRPVHATSLAPKGGTPRTRATGTSGAMDPADPVSGDSNILKAIKKLERHQKSAKQQSMFQYLRQVPANKSVIAPPIAPRGQQELGQRHLEYAPASNPESSSPLGRSRPFNALQAIEDVIGTSTASWRRASSTSNDERDRRVPTHVVHAVSPDEDDDYDNSSLVVGVRAPRQSASNSTRKRQATENLFAHFRFNKHATRASAEQQRCKVSSQQTLTTDEVLSAKTKSQPSTNSRGSNAKASKASAMVSRALKGSATGSEDQRLPSSIDSRPFFQSFLREKVRKRANKLWFRGSPLTALFGAEFGVVDGRT